MSWRPGRAAAATSPFEPVVRVTFPRPTSSGAARSVRGSPHLFWTTTASTSLTTAPQIALTLPPARQFTEPRLPAGRCLRSQPQADRARAEALADRAQALADRVAQVDPSAADRVQEVPADQVKADQRRADRAAAGAGWADRNTLRLFRPMARSISCRERAMALSMRLGRNSSSWPKTTSP